MPFFIALGSGGPNHTSWVAYAVLLWIAWYLVACALFPWRTCTWCDGGKKRDSSGKNWRDCRHCAGTGRRARVGRLVLQAMSHRSRTK